jgi:hypothetical protein
MSTLQRLWARVAAVGTGIGLALVVPALAWAGGTPLAVADEVERRRPRGIGLFGGLGAVCCLVVVGIIVLVVVLTMRKRR